MSEPVRRIDPARPSDPMAVWRVVAGERESGERRRREQQDRARATSRTREPQSPADGASPDGGLDIRA